jgi:catechol 2,3-dioxygenase-like lactoylglutathione lyase family enzyme
MTKITGTNVTIMTRDMDVPIAFYTGIGFSLQQRWDNHYAMLNTEGLTLGVHPSNGDNHNSGTLSIGLMVENIEDARDLLLAGNIASTEEDGKSGHYLHFTDPDNTHLYFVQPRFLQWK